MNKPFQPEVVHQWELTRIALLFGIAVLIGAGVIGVTVSHQFRTKAVNVLSSPASNFEVNAPPADLAPPYIRLVKKQNIVYAGENFPIDIYVDTGGKPVVEANLVLSYPIDVLELDSEVTSADVFKSVLTDEKPGSIITFFVTPTTGQKPVITTGEQKIGTLTFKAKLPQENVSIGIVFDKTETSALILYTEMRADSPTNLLTKGSETTFSVLP